MRCFVRLFISPLLAMSVGCSGESAADLEPLPGPVILRPAFIPSESIGPEYDPYALIETQYIWPGCCSEIVTLRTTPSERGPVSFRVLGVKVETYFESMAPAEVWLRLPRIPFDYELSLSYDDFTDRFRVHIDESLLVITPLERQFSIIHDTLARMPE
jgi:hypothetical protein